MSERMDLGNWTGSTYSSGRSNLSASPLCQHPGSHSFSAPGWFRRACSYSECGEGQKIRESEDWRT